MRAMLVSSFHISSTRDVWDKAIVGLRANGVEVVPFDMMGRFALYSFLEDKMKRSKRELPRDWSAAMLSYEVLLGAAVFHDCDWIVITSPQHLPQQIPLMMRKVGLKTAALFTECPYEDTIHTPLTASAFDAAFVSDLHSVGLFRSFCPVVEYLPHSYDPAIHHPPSDEGARDENIVFVGTGYESRVKFMRDVEWPVRLDLYGWWPKEWLRYDAKLRKSLRSTATTSRDETAKIYRASAASFSIHREGRYIGVSESIMDGEAYSLGPRNWELAACRTFQLSDFRPELADVFGDTVPMFETPQELGGLMKRAFAEPSWRREMAHRQWEKAQPYSCDRVMKTVADVLAA